MRRFSISTREVTLLINRQPTAFELMIYGGIRVEKSVPVLSRRLTINRLIILTLFLSACVLKPQRPTLSPSQDAPASRLAQR